MVVSGEVSLKCVEVGHNSFNKWFCLGVYRLERSMSSMMFWADFCSRGMEGRLVQT